MPLTLDTTVGGPNANGYAAQAAAVTYAGYKAGGAASDAAAFLALTSDQQIQALVTAAIDIDATDGFLGERASSTQSMQFPRSGLEDWGSGVIPPPVVRANIELAISYAPRFAATVTGDALTTAAATSNIKREKVDVIETEFFAPTVDSSDPLARFPLIVQNLLRSLVGSIDPAWGSGTVQRGS